MLPIYPKNLEARYSCSMLIDNRQQCTSHEILESFQPTTSRFGLRPRVADQQTVISLKNFVRAKSEVLNFQTAHVNDLYGTKVRLSNMWLYCGNMDNSRKQSVGPSILD
ncbi:hypothetical protein CLF_102973 [Clonorchis sinensis]|uniref:Uncharacterized protein n=1 Tax=Clonorchis sinensis TaxID=79923 RepID=G7YN98_CLOSI|nr:hypothetical protein CLF_102973 [Clonorchis sinensis]